MSQKRKVPVDVKNISEVLEILSQEIKGAQTPLMEFERVQTRDPFKILVATILSSRTRDEVTSKAARRLFSRADSVHGLARLNAGEIERLIYPVGFYKNKAKFLAALPGALEPFGGRVPDTMKELLALPGVGRKTANLVLSRAFDKHAICVDTHVHRLANMWGWVETKSPTETEQELKRLVPEKLWSKINSILVSFGQSICRPVAPKCNSCPLKGLCPGEGS